MKTFTRLVPSIASVSIIVYYAVHNRIFENYAIQIALCFSLLAILYIIKPDVFLHSKIMALIITGLILLFLIFQFQFFLSLAVSLLLASTFTNLKLQKFRYFK
jgi:hypothetical protein